MTLCGLQSTDRHRIADLLLQSCLNEVLLLLQVVCGTASGAAPADFHRCSNAVYENAAFQITHSSSNIRSESVYIYIYIYIYSPNEQRARGGGGGGAARLFLFLFFPVQHTTSGIGHRVK